MAGVHYWLQADSRQCTKSAIRRAIAECVADGNFLWSETNPGAVGPRQARLTLAHLEARVGLIDDVDAALAAHDTAILVALFRGAERVEHFHSSGFLRAC